MAKVNKKLSEYVKIWENRTEAKIEQLAEAATYFESVGGQFSDKAQDLKKELRKYTQTDMFSQIGSATETFTFGADDYVLGDSTKTTKKIRDEEILLRMRGEPGIPDEYFVETVALNKEKIYQDKADGKLPTAMDPFVTVSTQISLGLRKKAAT